MSTLCKSHNNNIKVFARFRPISQTEKDEEISQELQDNGPKFRSSQEVILKRPSKSSKSRQQFKAVLDHMFEMTTTQKEVFEVLGRPMVDAVLQGYNSTIFAYGQTGSGKTYTMFGPNKRNSESDLGLVQRSCNYLFDKLSKSTQGQVVEFQVEAAFIQIYKSHISDLLAPNSKDLRIKTDFQTNTPYIQNLKIVTVNSVEDILINLQIAFGNRKVASHKLNATSSRSHMLLMLTVVQKTRDGAIKKSKLNFGDLAGSEDIRKAHGKNSSQILKDEAIEINKSLSALTKAINFLSKGQRPSYRESPLTHILQDSLGGNSKTTMLVAASPHIMNREETIRTLRFAMTAQTVKNKAKVNKVISRSQLLRRIEELEAMNAKLKARVIELETGLRSQGIEVVGSLDITSSLQRADDVFGDDEKDEILQIKPRTKAKRTELKYSTTSIQQIDVLKQEIDAANERARKQQERNVELERRNMDLLTDIDTMEKQMKVKQEEMDVMKGQIGNFMKEREIMEQRNEELQKELSMMQNKFTKSKENMDKQIQRQRNNITMHQTEKKELQRVVQELNLQNESLLQQNELFMKQMNSLKQQNKDINKSSDNKPDIGGNEVDDDDYYDDDFMGDDEKNMDPAELLLHRFADTEANDFRLSKKQRMYKTAKMMNELSDDIDGLMKQWLPDKFRKNPTKNKYLVYRVRQLIGHFNVLVKQMKSNEESFQNDLKLDLKRRDQEIKSLKQEIQIVHQLKDDLLEKDDTIEQLKKSLNDLRVENEHLKSQTVSQQDTIFDIQSQCRYLRDELSKGNSSIKELQEKLEKAKNGKILSIDSDIADLDRDDISDISDVSSGSGEEESKSSEPLKRKQKKKKPKMSMWRESIKAGDRLDCKRESGAWCTAKIVGYRLNADTLQVRYDGWGDEHDEIVSRTSNRLAVHNSMTKYTNNGGNIYSDCGNGKAGYLVRHGFMFKEGKMFKTWRRRYFTLNSNGVMSYYHDKGDENAIGTFNVNDMKKTTRASFGKSKEYGLELYTDTRVWKFLCKNDKDLAEWIQAINSCSNK